MKMDKLIIKASSLSEIDYCEYKWYLAHVMGEEMPITKAMVKGAAIHEKKEEAFLEVATPTTIQDFLKSTKYTITKELFLKKEFKDFILMGRIDELAIDAKNVYVIDDKPKAHPWQGVKWQIYAYCVLFNENYPKLNKSLRAILRNRDNDIVVWNQPFTKQEEKELFTVLDRMTDLFHDKIRPVPNSIPNKCRACALHKENKCEFSCA